MSGKTYAQSKHQDTLCFNESPPDAEYFEHDFDGYSLEARVLFNASHDQPWVLSVHGARSDYTKSSPVTLGLRDRGYSVLGINMSGHSTAGVLQTEQTSLVNNITETKGFYRYLDPARQKILIGYSLGATPILKLLEDHGKDIDKIILFYPGIYTTEAYKHNFGDDFKQAISQPYSYKQNDTIDLLREFRGKVMLIIGEFDGLDPRNYDRPAGHSVGEIEIDGKKYYSPVPSDVIDMITEAVPAERLTFVRVSGCDHTMMQWMRQNPDKAEEILDKIDAFLKN